MAIGKGYRVIRGDYCNDVLEMPSPGAANEPGPTDPRFEIGVQGRTGQRCLRSSARFAAGEILIPFPAASVLDRPTRMTVQISEREHVELWPAFLSFINHACEPNMAFDVEGWALHALSPIAPREELAFFYPSTEWSMAAPFDCSCGSPRCIGRIAGASQVPEGALAGRVLAPHIRRRLAGARR